MVASVNYQDVIEYFLAGASAIQVGTASFIDPLTMTNILDDLETYCRNNNIQQLAELTGAVIDDQFESFYCHCLLRRNKKMSSLELTITRPDDWHLHLRDDDMMKVVLPYSSRHFGRAIIMPNLVPPVLKYEDAVDYRHRILEALPAEHQFEPMMTVLPLRYD